MDYKYQDQRISEQRISDIVLYSSVSFYPFYK